MDRSVEIELYDLRRRVEELERIALVFKIERDSYKAWIYRICQIKIDDILSKPLPRIVAVKDATGNLSFLPDPRFENFWQKE